MCYFGKIFARLEMPIIKIDHIVSFSSEDPVHVASNLLSNETAKKWKCKTAGERNAIVVLQLEKASIITAVDIGNENSAYVEVLVCRSGTTDDYKVLLVASSFMTPIEARQSQNVNKVRMFSKEHLSKPECDEKWDRVKIVCRQPFNKHVQYGLSFINLHTSNEKAAAPIQTHIGKFVLRPDSPDNLSVGSLFEKRKELKQEERAGEKLTGAAAIREASSSISLAQYGSPVCKPKLKTQNVTPSSKRQSEGDLENTPKPRNRNELLYSKDDEEPNEKIEKIMEKKAKEMKEKADKTPVQSKRAESSSSSKKNGRLSPKSLDVSITTPSSSKKKDKEKKDRKRKNKDNKEEKEHSKKAKKNLLTKPFSKLLEGVILVISGIQNPDRANLRTSALCMGAKYKSDWDNTCTHLICAFANTPKFNQVIGKGKIVTRKWIEDCYSQRKKLPWRRYALDKNDAAKDESEDEVCEEIKRNSPVSDKEEVSEPDYSEYKDEGSDTEERIARIQEKQRKNVGDDNSGINKEKHMKNKVNKIMKDVYDEDTDIEDRNDEKSFLQNKKTNEDIYDADTDEEARPIAMPASDLQSVCKLRGLFTNKKFYIDQSLSDALYNKVHKYIMAYDGNSIDDPTAKVDAIITSKDNSGTFQEINSSTVCLNPDWVWDCHNCQKLVPMDKYIY